MTISIIGSGKVGASVALNCGLRELDPKINLLDMLKAYRKAKPWISTINLQKRG